MGQRTHQFVELSFCVAFVLYTALIMYQLLTGWQPLAGSGVFR